MGKYPPWNSWRLPWCKYINKKNYDNKSTKNNGSIRVDGQVRIFDADGNKFDLAEEGAFHFAAAAKAPKIHSAMAHMENVALSLRLRLML